MNLPSISHLSSINPERRHLSSFLMDSLSKSPIEINGDAQKLLLLSLQI